MEGAEGSDRGKGGLWAFFSLLFFSFFAANIPVEMLNADQWLSNPLHLR